MTACYIAAGVENDPLKRSGDIVGGSVLIAPTLLSAAFFTIIVRYTYADLQARARWKPAAFAPAREVPGLGFTF
jgi:hypothetical protein